MAGLERQARQVVRSAPRGPQNHRAVGQEERWNQSVEQRGQEHGREQDQNRTGEMNQVARQAGFSHGAELEGRPGERGMVAAVMGCRDLKTEIS